MIQQPDGPVRHFAHPFQFHQSISSQATTRLIVRPVASPAGRRHFTEDESRYSAPSTTRPASSSCAHNSSTEKRFPSAFSMPSSSSSTCAFGGSPRPVVVWMKNGHLFQSTFEEEGGQHLADSVCPARGLSRAMGHYQCVASNEEGDDVAQTSVNLAIGASSPITWRRRSLSVRFGAVVQGTTGGVSD